MQLRKFHRKKRSPRTSELTEEYVSARVREFVENGGEIIKLEPAAPISGIFGSANRADDYLKSY